MSLSLPAIQERIQLVFEMRGTVITQPVFLTSRLSIPIYSTITSLTWTGPVIPFRGPAHYAGQDVLHLFYNLRSLKILFRPDSFATEDNSKCFNTYPPTKEAAQSLSADLSLIASACPQLEELIYPFWEGVYSLVSPHTFEQFATLHRLEFLAVDGPMKDVDYGIGLLKFIFELMNIGIEVNFANPWRSQFDILVLLEEADLVATAAKPLSQLAAKNELIFGPIGPSRNVWQGRDNVLDRLEWMGSADLTFDPRITLRWPVTLLDQPVFSVPQIFTGVEFFFNTPVARGNASQFLRFTKLMEHVVEIPHVERIRIQLDRIDAFYLAFPFFMQFTRNRVLTLKVRRYLLTRKEGWETIWIRREWRLRRHPKDDEEELSLKELAKEAIHVHPARVFERIMWGMMFSGERRIQEITSVFHDRYRN